MADSTKTHAAEFAHHGSAPLLAVRPGVPTDEAESLIGIILSHLRHRLIDAVGHGAPIAGDEAYLLSLLTDMAAALRKAAGSAV